MAATKLWLIYGVVMGLLFVVGEVRARVMVQDRYTFESTSTANVTFSGTWSNYQGPMYTGTPYTKSTTSTGATATYRPNFTRPQTANVLIYRFVEQPGQYPLVPYTGNDTNVEVRIIHAGKTNTVYLDSSAGQTGYWSAGVHDFQGGTNESVTIKRVSTGAGNATKAGLVRFEAILDTATVTQPSPDIPVGYSESGSWQATDWTGYSDYATPRRTAVRGAMARWNPGPLAARTLRVAFFVPDPTNAEISVMNGAYTNVLFRNTRTDQPIAWNTTTNGALRFQIHHNGKIDTVYCDTTNAPPGWYTLGSWDFAGTNAEYVSCARMEADGVGPGTVVDSVSFDDLRFNGSLLRSVIVTPLTNPGVITSDPRFLDETAFKTKLAVTPTPAGYSETGTWNLSSLKGATPWGRERYCNGDGHTATWNPLITEPGTYQVMAACMYRAGEHSPRNFHVVCSATTNASPVDLTPYERPGAFSLFWAGVGPARSFTGTNDEYCRILAAGNITRNDAVKFEKAVAGGALLKSILVSTFAVFPVPQFVDAAHVPEETLLAVEFVVKTNLMSGTSPTSFSPDAPATLGDYLQGVTGLLGLGGDPLTTAKTNGLLNNWPGISQSASTNLISRETALVIAQDAVRFSGKQFNITNLAAAVTNFADYSTVSSWARQACGQALGWEIASLDSTGRLGPQTNLSRADVALLLYNVAVKCLQAGPRTEGRWTLAFTDEFKGTQVNWNTWGFNNWDGANGAIGGRWPENAGVTNGLLILRNLKENRRGFPYSTAGLITRTYTPTNGYCECRLRLAKAGAQHTSWWGRKGVSGPYTNQFLEIDSPEAEYPNSVAQHLAGVPDFQWHQSTAFDISHDFHLYAWEWDTNGVAFFLDGVLTGEKTWASGNNYPYYFPLNVGLQLYITGGIFSWAGTVNFEFMEGSEVKVDWTRVYQKVAATRSNSPPAVAVTSPMSNAVFGVRSNVTVTASASDDDGTVLRVEFFGGPTNAPVRWLGSNTFAPFGIAWPDPTNGVYSVHAVAYDNAGGASTSAPVQFTVSVPPPPSLTSPMLTNGLFGFCVHGVTGWNYVVQASTNLLAWTNLFTTNATTTPLWWADEGSTHYPERFYRVTIAP